ncbi:MAG: hypothetical protein ACJ8AT_05170 [Hyalangium sp.]|uniref:hypothetical protein n=1 Tax=Hyalangium sp. TaxID=2028555 RepID=UPI00389AB7F1
MSHLLPTTDPLLAAPELAILHALETSLAAAQRALLTAYPELQDDLCIDRPLQLNGSGWIADAIVTQITGLSASIARYRREFERARLARLPDRPF